ncbi:MAG: hypothetical protein ACKV19_13570 [Verrucomicrobiales bacterium]
MPRGLSLDGANILFESVRDPLEPGEEHRQHRFLKRFLPAELATFLTAFLTAYK